jgi:hypothetical protein
MFPKLAAKGLALLKQAQPGLSRVAVLWNATNPANGPVWTEIETTARALLGLTLYSVPVRAPKDFGPPREELLPAFATAKGLPFVGLLFVRRRVEAPSALGRIALDVNHLLRQVDGSCAPHLKTVDP